MRGRRPLRQTLPVLPPAAQAAIASRLRRRNLHSLDAQGSRERQEVPQGQGCRAECHRHRSESGDRLLRPACRDARAEGQRASASQYGQAWYGSDWVKAGYPGEAWSATISGATGLFQVTSFIRAKKYQELGLLVSSDLPEPERFKANNDPGLKKKRLEWDRWRSIAQALDFGDPAAILDGQDMDQLIAANLGYKARPLSGIWATPPYLHNSSVPSLYQVLLPASRRTQKFYLGRTRFDPKHVGFETHEFPGAFLMDTAKSGNRNNGHEFRNLTLEELENKQGKTWNGRSSLEQRWALVLGVDPEHLSTMSTEQVWELTRAASRRGLSSPSGQPIKGVLGPEFTEEERWQSWSS